MCANMVITADIKNNVKIIDEYMNDRGYERFRLQDVRDDMGNLWALAIYTTKEQFPFNNYLVENNIEYLVHSAPITKEEHIDDMGIWPHSSAPLPKKFPPPVLRISPLTTGPQTRSL